MKSIEALQYLDDIAHGRIMDYDPHELKLIVEKDLEILAIIKNKIVNLEILKFLLEEYGNDKALEIYNLDNIILTKEEILKLKQWLEEKNHDN